MWPIRRNTCTCYGLVILVVIITAAKMGIIYTQKGRMQTPVHRPETKQVARAVTPEKTVKKVDDNLVPLDTQKFLLNKTKLSQIVSLVAQGKTSEHVKSCFMGRFCYKYIISPKDFCDDSETMLLIFVFSMEQTRERRDLIRKTWANNKFFGKKTMKVVFLIGVPKMELDLGESIEEEAAIYNDIVKYDFLEDVYNLTLKSLTGFEWANRFCPHATYVMKIDDDMFMNSFAYIKQVKSLVQKKKTKGVIFCYVWYGGTVFRAGTHSLNRTIMAKDHWPPFCSGSAYMMSMDAASKLLTLALVDQRKDMLPLDDPYITGLLASYTDLKFVELNDAYLLFSDAQKTRKPAKMSVTDWNKFLTKKIFWHIHDVEFTGKSNKLNEHERLWKDVLRFNNNTYYD